jgi:LuxR family transcriptional regulator, maltose regulon positive regulatory protein
MPSPRVATKLHLPKPRPDLVARPKLAARLDRGALARLTLISAPAGFGKTSLVAHWLSSRTAHDRTVAWIALDPADDLPAAFWAQVLAALQAAAVPAIGESILPLLESGQPPTEGVLAAVVNELSELPSELDLVLDDYHAIEDPGIHDTMTFLLDHLPPQVHVVITTCADPPLLLARLRARGELVEIRAADLRFSAEEASTYLNEVTGLGLGAQDVAALEERTEGWIAALQLAALSMEGRDDNSDFVARFTGNDRYIVDYLVDEVLKRLPAEVRTFLLDTSILDRLSGPLCDAVTGRGDSKAMLGALERRNLFVVPLDDQRRWCRYREAADSGDAVDVAPYLVAATGTLPPVGPRIRSRAMRPTLHRSSNSQIAKSPFGTTRVGGLALQPISRQRAGNPQAAAAHRQLWAWRPAIWARGHGAVLALDSHRHRPFRQHTGDSRDRTPAACGSGGCW